MNPTRIVIMAKAPVPGFCKTRLIPYLGADKAAHLARKMLSHTCREALHADVGPVELCVTPPPNSESWKNNPASEAVPQSVQWSAQCEGDLGQRLADICQRAIQQKEHCLMIGTDCPELRASHLQQASAALVHHDASLIPVDDGGYILLGVKRFLPSLFANMAWSTADVYALTVERMQAAHWRVWEGDILHDIDRAQDLRWLPQNWPERELI